MACQSVTDIMSHDMLGSDQLSDYSTLSPGLVACRAGAPSRTSGLSQHGSITWYQRRTATAASPSPSPSPSPFASPSP